MPIIDQLFSDGGTIRGGSAVVVGKYSFAEDGGAIGTIALMGTTAIPSGATILGGWLEVDTVLTGEAGAQVGVQVEAADDIHAAREITIEPWSTTGRKSIGPAFTGVTTVRTTAARDISIVISVAALTAGEVHVVLFYADPIAALL